MLACKRPIFGAYSAPMSGPRGVRLNNRHQDSVRAKIQASQIINRLQNHLNGEIDLTSTQVKAAEILLRKSIPDLSQVQGGGEDGAHEVLIRWAQSK